MNYPHVLAVLSQRIATRRHSIYCRRSAISHEAVPAEGGRHECPRDAPTDSDENEERRSECLVTARNALIPMDRHAREGSCSHSPTFAHAAMSHAVSMGREPGRKPLLRGRGVLHFEDFCRSTGLDPATVENLMRTELFDISMWKDEELTRPFGLFDDVLPSRQALAAFGLPVRDDYDPEALRSHIEDDEIDDAEEDSGPTWTM